jgi:uncharacterized Rmd1/YagE family protein
LISNFVLIECLFSRPQDVIHVKMDDLRHKHSIRLERIIVALILIEVTFGCVDHADQIAALARSLMS